MNDEEIERFLNPDEIAAFGARTVPLHVLAEAIARMRVALFNAIRRAREDDEPCPICQRESDEHHTAGCVFLAFPERLRERAP